MLSSVLLTAGNSGGGTSVSWLQTVVAAVLGGLLVAASNIFSARSNRKSAKEADARRAASDLELAKVKAQSDVDLAKVKAGSDERLAMNAVGRAAALQLASTAFRLRSGQIGSEAERRIAFSDAMIGLQMSCSDQVVSWGTQLGVEAIKGPNTGNSQKERDSNDSAYTALHTCFLNAVRLEFDLAPIGIDKSVTPPPAAR